MKFMEDQFSHKMQCAINDLRYLLNRGYKKSISVNFIGNHYLLNKTERNLLYRIVYSQETVQSRKSKLISLSKIKDNIILIDGFNVLITLESIFVEDNSIIFCDDGVIRDVNAVFGKYKFKDITDNAINSIIRFLKLYQPKTLKFFYDTPVSYSGKLAKLTEQIMMNHEISGTAETVNNVDYKLIELSKQIQGIVATSDGIIMDKVDFILDVPFHVMKK